MKDRIPDLICPLDCCEQTWKKVSQCNYCNPETRKAAMKQQGKLIMKHRGDIQINSGDFVRILEFHNLPSFQREAEMYRKRTNPLQVLPFMSWVNSLNAGTREDMMMLALSPENWGRFHSWEDKHLNAYGYCRMLFPIIERAEKFYKENFNPTFDNVIKGN